LFARYRRHSTIVARSLRCGYGELAGSRESGRYAMWIVRLALRRMYTFVVVALLIAVLGAVSIYRMSTDIFPNIDIPVVSVVWQYTGMSADDVETRIIYINERVLTASVNGIEHIESQSLDGVGVIRIYFQPGASIA